ncbi:hypothetical protein QJS66_00800 [Kocuria rhizophila]|nr:hypothetical protein QJS66_00800 [Kocuria rhizophila]
MTQDQRVVINEINTMPGSRPLPRTRACGRPPGSTHSTRIDELITLALERPADYADRQPPRARGTDRQRGTPCGASARTLIVHESDPYNAEPPRAGLH